MLSRPALSNELVHYIRLLPEFIRNYTFGMLIW